MQPATDATVAGDFKNARFTYAGVTSTFSRRDGKFVVRTDGPDGKLTDFHVKDTFGVDPLQQYLLELPGGRLQALTTAWDVERKRWFDLYPHERDRPRRAALDHVAELELYVRRVSLHRPAQELRCGDQDLPHHVCAHRCRLPGVPRPRFAPRRMGRASARLFTRLGSRRADRLFVDLQHGPQWAVRALSYRAGFECADRILCPLSFAPRRVLG